jgi:serine/threonine-protein kinase
MELIGRRFGHIRVAEVVGQGGMGDVYAGYDEKLERKVALKVLNSDQRLDDEARERLLREARALSKLDHPNICRIHDYIETGDVDLLVLEYIDGRTLHEALQERQTRGEKLRIAMAIAEVLVQAHRAGIVHRDLKPENVMLTRSGEVKVLDFGLARWLNRARARSSDRHAAIRLDIRGGAGGGGAVDDTVAMPRALQPAGARRELVATAAGITVGTPLFMSPEQARGETLTPASDMFSFGLLLQILFTGQDPHPSGLTARELILRVARGETEPVQNVAGDVTALINRLKQLAPADRLTAVETLERLRFLVEKPQRIARRSLVAVLALVAALGAWRYTVDLRAERAIAVAARAEADRRRGQAEDLIEFMLGDLRAKLEPVGRLDVLDDVGERALKYVGSSHPETMAADELGRGAKALNQLVEVRIAQGKLDDALALARRSLQMTTVAVRKTPHDPEAQQALATSHFWVGNVARLRGDTAGALREMQAYSAMTEGLVARYPDNENYQLERAYGHSVLATIMEAQGKLDDALGHYRSTREVKLARVVASPQDPERQADLAVTDNKIGFVLHRLGRIREARPYFESELAAYRKLRAADPQNVKWQVGEASSLSYLSLARESIGDNEGALDATRHELEIHSQLAGRDPENAAWQRNVALNRVRLASLHDVA